MRTTWWLKSRVLMYTLQIYKYTYRYFEWHGCHWEEVQLVANRKHVWDICGHSFPHHFSQSTVCWWSYLQSNHLWKTTNFQILDYYPPGWILIRLKRGRKADWPTYGEKGPFSWYPRTSQGHISQHQFLNITHNS